MRLDCDERSWSDPFRAVVCEFLTANNIDPKWCYRVDILPDHDGSLLVYMLDVEMVLTSDSVIDQQEVRRPPYMQQITSPVPDLIMRELTQ